MKYHSKASFWPVVIISFIAVALSQMPAFADSIINLAGVSINGISPVASGSLAEAYFFRSDVQTSGTGYIDPFLIIHLGNSGIEQGYNTDGAKLPWNTSQQEFTRNVQISELAVVDYADSQYYEFFLDASQNNNDIDGKGTISVDQIKIYTSATASIYAEDLNALGTLMWDMGSGNHVVVDAGLGSTSGAGSNDMLVLIPISNFSNANPNDYLYFYNLNGMIREANDGREQWSALLGQTSTVPEPSTILLLGFGLVGLAIIGRKKVDGSSCSHEE